MFLSRRSMQAESCDSPGRSLAEIAKFYASLNSVNRFFVFAEPFQRLLPKLLGQTACRSLSILDLGAGDGSLGKVLAPWAAKHGWNWRFTNLDIHFLALSLNHTGVNVVASALALPFRDASFDVVISNGVLNLVPEKERAFAEIVRILKPGGRLHLADIALDMELPEDARRNIDLWTG